MAKCLFGTDSREDYCELSVVTQVSCVISRGTQSSQSSRQLETMALYDFGIPDKLTASESLLSKKNFLSSSRKLLRRSTLIGNLQCPLLDYPQPSLSSSFISVQYIVRCSTSRRDWEVTHGRHMIDQKQSPMAEPSISYFCRT